MIEFHPLGQLFYYFMCYYTLQHLGLAHLIHFSPNRTAHNDLNHMWPLFVLPS